MTDSSSLDVPNTIPTDTLAKVETLPSSDKNPTNIVWIILIIVFFAAGVVTGYEVSNSTRYNGKGNPQVSATPTEKVAVTNSLAPTDAQTSYFGKITSIANNSLSLAEMRLISASDPSYSQYCSEENADCPDGFYIMDLHKDTTLQIDPNVQIKVINIPDKECALNNDISPVSVSLNTFIANACNFYGASGRADMDLTVSGGKVIQIVQKYFP